jgi:hypothetical protein
MFVLSIPLCARGGVVIEALRYKPEGRGFDSRLYHWIFSLTNLSGRTMALGSTQPLTEIPFSRTVLIKRTLVMIYSFLLMLKPIVFLTVSVVKTP